MEYRFYRELKHNYLVIKADNQEDKKKSYQLKMLQNGNLKGFMPCDLRNINNESFLYYEINSMQSIRDRFSVRGMKKEELVRFFSALKASLDTLSEYLLGLENVILDVSSIYTDLSTGEYRFMYYPYTSEQKSFGAFVDELFDLVDQEDQSAIEMIYDCCEKAQNKGMLVYECVESLLSAAEDTESEDIFEEYENSMKTQFVEADFEEDDQDLFRREKKDDEDDNQSEGAGKRLGGKVQIIFALLFFAVVGAMVYIRMNYILSQQENVLSIIVMTVSMITGISAFLSGLKDILSHKTNKGIISNGQNREKEDFAEYDEDEDYSYEDFESIKETKRADADRRSSNGAIDIHSYHNTLKVTSGNMEKIAADETVVLEEDDFDKSITLFSRNTDKTIRICLDKLPLTVGKLEGCVDRVISDMSISRIHCRFSQKEDGRIILTDLNSTNGTFRNGLKLDPQTEQVIEEGDEVRIGRICFDCR